MTRHTSVKLVLTPGEPVFRWCEGCNTSAGYTLPMHIMGESGLADAGSIDGCERCGANG